MPQFLAVCIRRNFYQHNLHLVLGAGLNNHGDSISNVLTGDMDLYPARLLP